MGLSSGRNLSLAFFAMSSYTPSSGAYFNDDGSAGIGVECFFQQGSPSKATQSWNFTFPVKAIAYWGNVSMRTSGQQADVLIGVFLDGREIWGAILKGGGYQNTVNLPAFVDPELTNTQATASVLRVDMEAAGSGDAWNPLNCEIRLCGRWQ